MHITSLNTQITKCVKSQHNIALHYIKKSLFFSHTDNNTQSYICVYMHIYVCICVGIYRHGQDVLTMSDMAYDNNAVHLTIDAYISKNIEKENENKNKNENESYDENKSNSNRDSNSENKNDDRNEDEDDNNRVDNISNSINDYSIKTSCSNSNSISEEEDENEDDDILSFSDQRKSSYDNWNAAPHTPYEQVS